MGTVSRAPEKLGVDEPVDYSDVPLKDGVREVDILHDGGLLIPSGVSAKLAGLVRADLGWPDCMITCRVPLDRTGEAFDPGLTT